MMLFFWQVFRSSLHPPDYNSRLGRTNSRTSLDRTFMSTSGTLKVTQKQQNFSFQISFLWDDASKKILFLCKAEIFLIPAEANTLISFHTNCGLTFPSVILVAVSIHHFTTEKPRVVSAIKLHLSTFQFWTKRGMSSGNVSNSCHDLYFRCTDYSSQEPRMIPASRQENLTAWLYLRKTHVQSMNSDPVFK